MSKEDEPLGAPRSRPQLLVVVRRSIIAHTLEKHPEKLPSDMWWVITYAVAPAVDEINITFAKLQSRSLLVAQQAEFVNALIGTLTAMFCIEVIDPD